MQIINDAVNLVT